MIAKIFNRILQLSFRNRDQPIMYPHYYTERRLHSISLTERLPSLMGKERCRLPSVCAWFIVGCTTMNSNEGKPITGPCAPGIRFPFSPFFFSFTDIYVSLISIYDLISYFYTITWYFETSSLCTELITRQSKYN